MDRIFSIDEIMKQMTTIRNLQKGYVSNFFLDETKHTLWIEKEILYKETIGETFFVVKCNECFWNVFYITTTIDSLKNDFEIFKSQHQDRVLMVDVVNRKELCEEVASSLAAIGLSNYCKLVRMSKKVSSLDEFPLNEVVYASKEDAVEIHNQLNLFFDERAEQLPFLEELKSLAERHLILVLKKHNKIAGFVIFELNKLSLYLRYWFVHPENRNLGLGSKLLSRFFWEGRNTKRAQHWVICSNENALKRYHHYGYVEENLYDYILTNKGDFYEGKNH